jgi:AcrR family transcriptional regulator
LTQARAIETRARVLHAAAVLFDEKGYEATTLNDIVKGSGMTKGAVYHHFSSKAAIAVEIVRHLFDGWPPMLAAIRSGPGDPLEQLIRISFALARSYREDQLVRAAVRLSATREIVDDTLPQPFVGWERMASDMLQAAAAEGVVSPAVSCDAMGRLIVAGFFGAQHVSDVLDRRGDLDERLLVMWETLLPRARGDPANQRAGASVPRPAPQACGGMTGGRDTRPFPRRGRPASELCYTLRAWTTGIRTVPTARRPRRPPDTGDASGDSCWFSPESQHWR